jgi:hypothetical protein
MLLLTLGFSSLDGVGSQGSVELLMPESFFCHSYGCVSARSMQYELQVRCHW